jgi:hypothetical protein
MERIIFKRIGPIVEKAIPLFQAGFPPNKSCSDQVFAVTSCLEKGYNISTKTGAAFTDLSAAYDTVWKHCFLLKLAKIITCQILLRYLGNSLGNRNLRVLSGDRVSKSRILNNGLPQGSVLAPKLFNIYTHDFPSTVSKQFIYTDDISIATQCKYSNTTEQTLKEDRNVLDNYFNTWRHKPNPSKTAVSLFYVNNRVANQELTVIFCGHRIKQDKSRFKVGASRERYWVATKIRPFSRIPTTKPSRMLVAVIDVAYHYRCRRSGHVLL